MISGMMNLINKHHKIAWLLLTLFFTVPAHALEPEMKLADILQLFAQQKQSTADFEEEKHTFYLDEPITSSGHLQFIAPDKLFKFILTPEKISQKVNGNELEIKQADQIHTVQLNEYPEFSIILRSLISVLSGNHATLKKDFKISFENKSPDLNAWSLLLSPHDSYISSYVESIKMVGIKNKLIKIIVTEPNNDRTITRISNHR